MLKHTTPPPAAVRGVTLIEIAIGLVIVALTMMFGLPSLADWLHNTRIRNTAEGVQNGLQMARAEAVRRNANVEFVLTSPGTVGGAGWSVRVVGTGAVVQSKPNAEGSTGALLTVTPGGADRVTFNGFGRLPTAPAANDDGSAFITRIDVDSAVLDAGTSRDLRILIGSGGQIRMCDPNVTDATDPRSC